MPAKILNAFTDENPDLHKQIGCMTGILQMFDRQHLLTGRRLNDHCHKKHPSGQALSNGRNYGEVCNSSSQQILLERNLTKSLNENRRVSIDSSRASFSSSSSSSSSSFIDCNKSTQQEAASFDRTFFQERSLKAPLNPKANDSDAKYSSCGSGRTATTHHGRQYHDLLNVVKDSMQRHDKNLLPDKTMMREEERDQAAKERNSPRLQFLSKATEGTYETRINSKPKAPEDLNESVRVLLKLKQAKDSSCYQVTRESPRFSCDGREFSRPLIDSRDDSKAIIAKLRDLPRLSLDSRARSSNLVSRANSLMEDLNRTTATTPRLCKASSLHEDPGSYKRPPGLVAKLMGLEELPKSREPSTKQINGSFTTNASAKSPNAPGSMKESKACDFPRSSSAPKAKICGPTVKQNSRITTEAAPWVQQERRRVAGGTAVGRPEAKMKKRTASVYSEIVKKLKELEFQQSNKDLRALKQILDGMHAKALSEATKEDSEQQPPPSTQGRSREQIPARKHSTKSSCSPRAIESPNSLVKPAKSVGKSGVPPLPPTGNQSGLPRLRTSGTCDRSKESASNKTDKDQSPRVSPRLLNAQALLSVDKQLRRQAGEINAQKPGSNPLQSFLKVQHSLTDDSGSLTASSCSVSPRLQQRRAQITSPELSKAQKLSASRQQAESASPRGKFRLKQAQTPLQKIEDKANESPREKRKSSCQVAISKRSDKNINLASLLDLEAILTNRSMEMKCALLQQSLLLNQSNRVLSNATSLLNQTISLPILNEYAGNKDLPSLVFDQASPVSVLDTPFHQDGRSTSPEKRTLNAQKDDETTDNRFFTGSPVSAPSKLTSEVVTLKSRLTVDSLTSKFDMVSPDHKYVAEILQATGLLQKDLIIGSKCRFPVQTHSSGQAINPDLFFVLEQLKPSRPSKPECGQEDHQPNSVSDKSHRKLVFDMVNEILAQKLELMACYSRLQFQIPDRKINGQWLLQELCTDIDKLQAQNSKKYDSLYDDADAGAISREDIVLQTQGWTEFRTERHQMVLEIERLIFKDLISDIISDVAGPKSGQANCQPAACSLLT